MIDFLNDADMVMEEEDRSDRESVYLEEEGACVKSQREFTSLRCDFFDFYACRIFPAIIRNKQIATHRRRLQKQHVMKYCSELIINNNRCS